MTRPLWTLPEIAAATGGRLDLRSGGPGGPATADTGPDDRAAFVSGVSIDTRSLDPGDLFVPLTDARDGHEYITHAFERGAAAALARRGYIRKPGDGCLIRVPDVAEGDSILAALEAIGMAARRRLSDESRVVAVTGSAGKTGTKEMLRACLQVCASSPEKVHAPEKSFNNHWGVPLTLARMPADTQYAVFEIGMNHAGEIRPLVKMVRPHIAIVTNVLPVHVGNFPDGEIGVANAKAEIFEGLEAGGTAIIPWDNEHFELLSNFAQTREARIRPFSTLSQDERADAWLTSTPQQIGNAEAPREEVTARLRGLNGISHVHYEVGTPGGHIVGNSLAVLLALDSLGCLSDAALKPLAAVKPPPGRGQRVLIEAANILVLDESYNANPRSMHAALVVLRDVPRSEFPRKVAVIGDMLELGQQASQHHKSLAGSIASADIDRILCCGRLMRELYELLPPEKQAGWAQTSQELISSVRDELRPGDAVMVKGSLGSRMALIVDAIKKRFADAGKGG